jgi:GNAT superfamily N-acetyltransferase
VRNNTFAEVFVIATDDVIYRCDLPAEDDLFDLYEALGWNDFLKLSPNQLLTAMKKSFYSVYAYAGSKSRLIGTGRVVSDGVITACLCGLGVLPDYRRRGIGAEISKKLANYCKQHNLHIQFFCEESLVPYYEKAGFRKFAIGMKL